MNRHPAPAEHRASDAAVIELLRVDDRLGVGDLAKRLGVTATAVRQRLDRLMRAGLVGRTTCSSGPSIGTMTVASRLRGRPSHIYSLTEKGRRTGGDNFRDLALVLWREIRSVREPAVRQGLISRIGAAMAGMYRDEVSGVSPRQRLESTAKILQERRISCGVEPSSDPANGGLPVLTSYACPYPDLAEQDRGICAAERIMLQELVGSTVHLSECRLDGAPCCRFTVNSNDQTPPAHETALSVSGATCIQPD
jgi:predicted ArsR family transcriptional regulator